ncbi:DUF4054 domain-containing protein [Providencia sp.]|uniref:DUF4054 domain-containing protein n=1 Tax=Providencia sp. TaxID=589 RepID=UPI0035B2ECFC
MDTSTFPIESFRVLYPQFSGIEKDEILIIAQSALNYFSPCRGVCTNELWMLVVAHMLSLRKMIADDESPTGVVTSVTIDKVSVSFTAPPAGSDWSHWFKMTTYGQQFLALIKRCSVPLYFGSAGERSAFRGVGGRFTRGGRLR